MVTTETRISLVDFKCPGCDCGTCVTESMQEIRRIPGVDHVRADRRRTQIVVRHEPESVTTHQLVRVVEAMGIRLA